MKRLLACLWMMVLNLYCLLNMMSSIKDFATSPSNSSQSKLPLFLPFSKTHIFFFLDSFPEQLIELEYLPSNAFFGACFAATYI